MTQKEDFSDTQIDEMFERDHDQLMFEHKFQKHLITALVVLVVLLLVWLSVK